GETSSTGAAPARTRPASRHLLLTRVRLLRLGRTTGRALRERRRQSDSSRHGVLVIPSLHLLPLLGGVSEVNAGAFLRDDPGPVRVQLRNLVSLRRERRRGRIPPDGFQAPDVLRRLDTHHPVSEPHNPLPRPAEHPRLPLALLNQARFGRTNGFG